MALPSAGPTDCSSGLSNRIFNNLRYDNPWQASQSGVQVGTLCCPVTPAGIGFKCTAITTGITGSVEPTWPVVLTNTVVDGGVTWTAQDIANPTGNAHPPTGYFGYLFTSNDLDGFRLLAYDIAKGACDEIVADACSAMYHMVGAQNFGTGGYAVVNYDTKDVDTDNAVTTGASWAFTVPTGKGGRYLVSAVAFTNPGASTGIFSIEVHKNGTQHRIGQPVNLFNATAYGLLAATLSTEVNVAAGNTLQVKVWQNTGINQALIVGVSACVSIERVLGS